jgi:8-oxo-dGTP diphosphatase
VQALVVREEAGERQVLLVWNADWRNPCWGLPGGAREPAEPLCHTAVRETREETGLNIRLGELIDIHEIVGLGKHVHLVIFTFRGQVTGGSLCSDGTCEPTCGGVSKARWFPIEEARRLGRLQRILSLEEQVKPGSHYSFEKRKPFC